MISENSANSSKEQSKIISSGSDKDVEKEQVLSNSSDSVLALRALQLLVKDIENIKDPIKAAEIRKKCYAAFDKIVENVDSGAALKIREESKRFIRDITYKTASHIIAIVGLTAVLLYSIHSLATSQPTDFTNLFSNPVLITLVVLTFLLAVAFTCLTGYPLFKELKGKK